MAKYDDLKLLRTLSNRGDTNSKVDLLQDESTNELFVRKTIFGINQPLYQAIFAREIRALYKLNNCDNIVQMLSYKNMKVARTNEKVGCIFLEYIFGEVLSKCNLTILSSKDKFNILKQLLNAIEAAHSNGIIHRDINPNNIMITDQKEVKMIDFGICKIKEMISSSTLYKMGTNLYSAPEVHLQSENATEQSDLYSIGAVVYYLFTGKTPPIATDFQQILDGTTGIDIELKPIIRKLVSEHPEDRYKDIFELRIALTNLFTRFLDIHQQINVVMDFEKFKKLQKQNLIPPNARIFETHFISQNFIELFATKNENDIYQFLGLNYLMDCIFDIDASIFRVLDFKKIVPIERARYKNAFAEIFSKVQVVDPRYLHRQPKNDSLEIKNIIDAFYEELISKSNVDTEYRSKYGVWRELLNLTKESIEKNIVRLSYESYHAKDGQLIFALNKGVFLGNESLNREHGFIYEKPNRGKKKLKPIFIGFYEDDYFDKDHVVLKIRFFNGKPNLPHKGIICLDYRQDMTNVQRQLDALDTVENEDYSCPFNLKRILSGIETPKTKLLVGQFRFFNELLDMSQRAAVEKALNSDSICIIQGPPGTGKTNVVIEIIRQILLDNQRNRELPEKKILLVSQSHPAVDKMLLDLLEQTERRPNLIRIGRDDKLNETIKEDHSLQNVRINWIKETREHCTSYAASLCDELQISHNDFKLYCAESEKAKVEGHDETTINRCIIDKIIKNTQTPHKEKLRKLLEIQEQWIQQLPQCSEVDLYIIKSTTIIAGTCTGFISNRVISSADFDYLIIDEAAKATYPELAVSLGKANKIIMVGDHKQLPPVLDDDIIDKNKDKIDRNRLSSGIFEKLYESFPEENKHRLTVQYRMHPAIGTLISQVFYENEIQNGIEVEKREIDIDIYHNIAIEWLDTSSFDSKVRFEQPEGTAPRLTYRNNLELRVIRDKLEYLDTHAGRIINIAVITAYGAQKYALENMIKQRTYKNLSIEVDTVDAFQGSQKEIVIYSTVRSNSNPFKIGFLRSEARLNVAFSRAKSLLIIVGDQKFLNNRLIRQNRFPDIIDYVNTNDYCRTVDIYREGVML